MIFHKQQHFMDTPGLERGSCYPTVLACILDLPLDHVPNFHLFYWKQEERQNIFDTYIHKYCAGSYGEADGQEKENHAHNYSMATNLWWTVLQAWLASKRLCVKDISSYFDEWLKENPDTPYMVSGLSSRGVEHIVIHKDGKLFHDPHPSNEGLVPQQKEPLTYEILEKI